MADESQLAHLRFERTQHENPRRTRRGRGGPPPEDQPAHGRRIREEVEKVEAAPPAEAGFDPRLLLKLEVDNPDPAAFESIPGLSLVGQEDKTITVLFATEDGLREFKRRLELLEAGEQPTRKEILWAVESVSAWERDDRLGVALRAEGIPTERSIIDVELWPLERRDERDSMLQSFRAWCEEQSAEVLDLLRRSSVIAVRVKCNPETLERLLHHRDVRGVDLPPRFGFEFGLLHTPIGQIPQPSSPRKDAPTIAVLDTGVVQNHPLLQTAIGDAQSFVPDAPAEDENGHGTHVAGLALYGDVEDCAASRSFVPKFRILSGRISDAGDGIGSEFLENHVVSAVEYFVREYGCRIFNLSFADNRHAYTGGHVGHLAAVLDELAAQYEILFVAPTGNFGGGDSQPKWRTGYPEYLFREDARILDPAPALNVLTVGSIARHEASRQAQRHSNDPAYHAVARRDQPSPFTRTGPGPGGAIKPDVVAYGGNWAVDGRMGEMPHDFRGLGELSLNRYFAGGNLFVLDTGTSHAAPKIASLAAQIFAWYPDASANLLRAIVVAHARIPDPAREVLGEDVERQRYGVGYGVPRRDLAVHSRENCVTLLAEATLEDDRYHYYELPIPPDLLINPKRRLRRITVAVSHMPPVRRTRYDYRANRLDFRLVRADSVAEIDAIYQKDAEDSSLTEPAGVQPKPTLRDAGTLQCATWDINQTSASWKQPFVIVSSRPPVWGRADGQRQSYALVVVIEDCAGVDVRLYTQVRTQLRTRARVRV